ncbi:immune inhibitor A [Mumia sp. zg.B53]|uniref:M14 family metallopeptidase n=1 Tax=Mumia sp. zg.B53 TaxID=2855449 RepID=UPI001C6EBF5A|nr:M14 family metallopeptidase [Mumia sp. zg.B53]MBW9214448.1 immune inhibitor A [Mumia sp. zg.B53]
MRRPAAIVFTTALVGGLLGVLPATAAPPKAPTDSPPVDLEIYSATVDAKGLDLLAEAGVDRSHDVVSSKGGKAEVEVVLPPSQARKLREEGVDLKVKKIDGVKASTLSARQSAAGYDVFTSYSEAGGIRDDMVAATKRYPRLTKLVKAGKSGTGQDILAVKVGKNASKSRDGSKPAVLYGGTQHAREWITPEMVQRLMHYMLDRYGKDRRITKILDTTELWFLPVQNPDGYDFTFTEGNRLWRKTVRDNNGDGQVTAGDGVDMNRNFPFKWGYDNEGSSPQPFSETYRGPAPASEPETRATIGLVDKVGFEFFVNYHSAAELLLYGTGWQVETPTPDDEIYAALAGNDANPAVPGYDPDLSAELYTTNGDTNGHVHEEQGTLAYTPEMATCETASASDPDDEWDPAACVSIFSFPDDEELVQAEFEKNIPFALSLAESAHDPDDPKSSVGITVKDIRPDVFTTSYGRKQTVAVTAKRKLKGLLMTTRINGRVRGITRMREWRGGEKYGNENDKYYDEYRAEVKGQKPGDRVTVTFTGLNVKPLRGSRESFSYTVADDIGGDVLILAAEDYTGLSPAQAVSSPKYVSAYADALNAAGYSTDVYDVDAAGRTAPHDLGVLSHYDAVVWETGDDLIPRNTGQIGGTAAKWAYDTELRVRDYLNEGGKVLVAGKYALYAQAADGSYYYHPDEETAGSCTTPGAYPCLPLGNDFLQYWLGSYQYVDDGGTREDGTTFPLQGDEDGPFEGFTAQLDGSQDHTGAFVSTSSFLPVEEFPQFESSAPLSWLRGSGDPYAPFTGDWFMTSGSADQAYKRLATTVDLTGATSGSLDFKFSADVEAGWDAVFVEARPVGTDDWTTLPDANGNTTQATGESCTSGWAITLHPQLTHYVDATCQPTGTTGEWNAFSGNSGGWQDWSADLSAYAGQQVEVAIVYATDWGTTGLGVWIDDAKTTVGGATATETSFETDLGAWTVPGAPAGSGVNPNDWERGQQSVDEGAAVMTPDSVLFGFGLEGLDAAKRQDLLSRSLDTLLDD